MDYSYYTGPRPQPFSLYGLPTPDQQPQTQTDEAFADSFPLVRSPEEFLPESAEPNLMICPE